MNWSSMLASTALALFVILPVEAANAQKYNFITIDVPSAVSTNARGIASDGSVMGFYRDQSFAPHGFVRSSAGTFTFPIDYTNPSVTIIGTELNRSIRRDER